MSPLILNDMLGDDAIALVKKIVKGHLKSVRRNRLVINDIYRSVKYFNQMFEKRRKALMINTKKSKDTTYAKVAREPNPPLLVGAGVGGGVGVDGSG